MSNTQCRAVGEWELYDLETDPSEMKNQIDNPEYADVAVRMRQELDSLRRHYEVPENEPMDLGNVSQFFHSSEQLKRAGRNATGKAEGKLQ
ncbi:sulfatase/phosphatase domain-containing protein [Pontiella sulfatireligans]|uniref:N-sulphoglucosamine sulphohydrolase C-terminal domain-containing protein n=1 Tax=Pontiella sulfatireligans TaxID=2750658 RepID=A0A6C2UGL2_9BACT|nr:sulfatase/phosphatase domain-containing protein [Pontiella sulfatireligans]VGO18993.1 hypothetical protein SCARR_01047 [Pontiella sulfatireligans]